MLAAHIKLIHEEEPSCGVRGTWSLLRHRDGAQVNRKKVHRLMKIKGWILRKRRAGNRPRVAASVRWPIVRTNVGPPTSR